MCNQENETKTEFMKSIQDFSKSKELEIEKSEKNNKAILIIGVEENEDSISIHTNCNGNTELLMFALNEAMDNKDFLKLIARVLRVKAIKAITGTCNDSEEK